MFANALSPTPKESKGQIRPLKEELTKLLGSEGEGSDAIGNKELPTFLPAFELLFEMLKSMDPMQMDIGLPKVMRATLSPNLLQVLLFWTITALDRYPEEIKKQRHDLIRFVMFWRLCVTNEDKASNLCFTNIKRADEFIRKEKNKGTEFLKIKELFEAIVDFHKEDGAIAIPLLTSDKMEDILCKAAQPVWRNDAQRFPDGDTRSTLARLWWKSGKDSLVWLQRGYLETRFKYFNPATGRDDDTPYDVDHMVPQSDWARNFQTFTKAIKRGDSRPDQYDRRPLGDSIGNLRLIDFTENRSNSDVKFAEKALPPGKYEKSDWNDDQWKAYFDDMAFDKESDPLWRRASGVKESNADAADAWQDGINSQPWWDADRLSAFQQAVEMRAAWLYWRFYSELGFATWEGTPQTLRRFDEPAPDTLIEPAEAVS